MTTRRLPMLTLVLAVTTVIAACSPAGAAPPTRTPSAPPTPTPTPSAPAWPQDWGVVVCQAADALDGTVADVSSAYTAAKDGDAVKAANSAKQAASVAATSVASLSDLTVYERGKGVAVNLLSAAKHLQTAANQLVSWSSRASSAKLTKAASELKAARTNVARATTNRTSLEKAVGFTCD